MRHYIALAIGPFVDNGLDCTNGSAGLASVSKDELERSTLLMVRAGLHWSFKMSRQIA